MYNYNFTRQEYEEMFDRLLSQELCFESSAATEYNIKKAMKRILGISIKNALIKRYSDLVLDESLNVHFTIVDLNGTEFSLILYYGK